MKAKQILTVLLIVLALLLIGIGWWGFKQQGEKNQMIKENELLTEELDDIKSLKAELEVEVDSLQTAYDMLYEENSTLQGELEDEKSRVGRRNATIKKLKAEQGKSDSELGSLRTEIQNLMAVKADLESSIQSLQAENDSLRVVTGILEADLGKATEENEALANLNKTIQEEVKRLTLANFKASAFRVELEKKNAKKVTSKSKRAKRINVSFDLTNVPEKYRGVRPIYLVITDDKATPIKLENPIKAQVTVNGQLMDITAAELKEVDIAENQRLSFTHNLSQKLGAGYYRAAVYTDIGLLGANSFRLR